VTPKDKSPNLYTDTFFDMQCGPRPYRHRGKAHPTEGHKFSVGQTLFFEPSIFEAGTRGGAYSVVRLLPAESGDNQYRLKNIADGHERVVRESQLSSK
jgi:hypothetical protein